MADYVELLPVSPFYRLCWEDGYSFDYVNDQVELDRQIYALNPRDVAGYQRFLAYSRAVYEAGYVKLGTVPFLSFSRLIGVVPPLSRSAERRVGKECVSTCRFRLSPSH